MNITNNLWLNRYEWAALKVDQIVKNKNLEVFDLYDIGSRDNILKKRLDYPGLNYSGFDLEPLTDARQWNIEHSFPYGELRADIVTLLEVVEHLFNPGICLKNVADIIKQDGFLILTTPNPKWSTSRLNFFNNGALSCFTQSDLDLNHHVFTPWHHIMETLLRTSGFSIIECVTLDGKTVILDKTLNATNFLRRIPARLIKKFIEYKDSAACGMSYGILAKKTSART